jgi:hypothetical protein
MKKLLLPLLAVAVIFCACVPSLQPLYTAETTVFREELVGIWKEEPQKEDNWTFTKGENNAYNLTIREDNESSIFEARLVKLGEHLFLDLYPSSEPIQNAKFGNFYRAALVPGHLILKVNLGEKLQLKLIEPDKLGEFLKANPKALAHTFVEGDRMVITASTADLQAFFKKHADTKELWGDPGLLQKLVL